MSSVKFCVKSKFFVCLRETCLYEYFYSSFRHGNSSESRISVNGKPEILKELSKTGHRLIAISDL